MRRHEQIILPSDYVEIYPKFGKVLELGNYWKLYNIKKLQDVFKKCDGISEQKRFNFKKTENKGVREVKIMTQAMYRNDDPSKKYITLVKRGKSVKNVQLEKNVEKPGLSVDKARAVDKLLKASFGENWMLDPGLSWYFDLFAGDLGQATINNSEEVECDCAQHEEEIKS